MNTKIILLIFCMMLVTYIPRMLPSFITDRLHLGKKFKKFLELIPYTAMAALIFPGIIFVDESAWMVGAVGAVAAIGLSLIKKMPVIVVVIAAVLADMLVYQII